MALRYGVPPDFFDDWWNCRVSTELQRLGIINKDYAKPLTDAGLKEVIVEFFGSFF